MALLLIFFIFIAVINLICIALLFLVKDPKMNNIFFVGTVILGVLICYLNITSLASNLIVPQIVAGFFWCSLTRRNSFEVYAKISCS